MNSKKLKNRLKDYSALAGAFLVAGPAANAAIVCNDINQTLNCGDNLPIDIDGDGTNDFDINLFNSNNSCLGSVSGLNGSVAAQSEYVTTFYSSTYVSFFGSSYPMLSAFTDGDSLGSNFYNYGYFGKVDFFGTAQGNWTSATNAFIGVQFDIGGFNHFGWIHLDRADDGSITVLDVAYEDVPDTRLNAGDGACNMPDPGDAVPTMGEWGLINLALLILTFGIVAIKNMQGESNGSVALDGSRTLVFRKPSLVRIKEAIKKFFS